MIAAPAARAALVQECPKVRGSPNGGVEDFSRNLLELFDRNLALTDIGLVVSLSCWELC